MHAQDRSLSAGYRHVLAVGKSVLQQEGPELRGIDAVIAHLQATVAFRK